MNIDIVRNVLMDMIEFHDAEYDVEHDTLSDWIDRLKEAVGDA